MTFLKNSKQEMVLWWFKSFAGKKIHKFGCVELLATTGRPLSTHNAENSESVHSQEDRPHSHCSVRQIAREAQISSSSVHNIIKKDL